MRSYTVATLPGDGIGPEVLDVATAVMTAAAGLEGLHLHFTEVSVSAARYLSDGALWSDAVETSLAASDAILLGAVGHPAVAPGVLERGVIVRLRDTFRQAVNVRPVAVYPGVENPYLRDAQGVDLVIVRENTEGAYASEGTVVHGGTTDAVAVHDSVNTYAAIRRALEFGFDLAQTRRQRLTLCHKTNIMIAVGGLWMQVLSDLRDDYTDVEVDYLHVDAMGYHLLTNPGRFDVVVTDNLFGDIITDVAAVLQGGLGLAASANVNLDGSHPSMFEPVHGSAPDIAGQGLANPMGAVLSAVLCLGHLGEHDAARRIEAATARAMVKVDHAAPTLTIREAILENLTTEPDEECVTPMADLGLATRGGRSAERVVIG